MPKLRFALVLAILTMMPLSAMALEGPAYKFVEGGYSEIDSGGSSSSEDGWFAGVMYGGRNWQAFAEYDDFDDASLLFVGAGWHGLLGETADVVAQLSYLEVDTTGSSSEDGYRATGGVRWQIVPFLEVAGFVHHTDVTDSDDSLELRVVGYLDRFGIGASWESNDVDITKVFVRWSF